MLEQEEEEGEYISPADDDSSEDSQLFLDEEEIHEGDEEGNEENESEDDEDRESESDDDDDSQEDGEEVVDQLTLAQENDSSDGETTPVCPICLDKLKHQDIGSPESCDHEFCLECIVEWSKNVNTCPSDRQPFHIILARHPEEDKVFKRIKVEEKQKEEEEELEEEEDLTFCEVCRHSDHEERLLLCDGCDLGYHCECLTPPLDDVPVEEWFCPTCSNINGQNDSQEEEDVDLMSLPRRQIARTRASERVRHRIQINRMHQRRPLELMSSEDESNADVTSSYASASSSKCQPKKVTSGRKTTKRKRTTKRKGTKKRRVTKNGISKSSSTTKAKTTQRKRRKRRNKRKKKGARKSKKINPRSKISVTSQAFSIPVSKTIKGRIAERLGLSKPPPGRTIPLQRRAGDRALERRYGDNGITTLSILGEGDELIEFRDMQESSSLSSANSHTQSSSFSCHPKSDRPFGLKRPIPVIRKTRETPEVNSCAPSSFDLLGSIFQGQSLLHMKSQDIIISPDGSLKVTKLAKVQGKNSGPVSQTTPVLGSYNSNRATNHCSKDERDQDIKADKSLINVTTANSCLTSSLETLKNVRTSDEYCQNIGQSRNILNCTEIVQNSDEIRELVINLDPEHKKTKAFLHSETVKEKQNSLQQNADKNLQFCDDLTISDAPGAAENPLKKREIENSRHNMHENKMEDLLTKIKRVKKEQDEDDITSTPFSLGNNVLPYMSHQPKVNPQLSPTLTDQSEFYVHENKKKIDMQHLHICLKENDIQQFDESHFMHKKDNAERNRYWCDKKKKEPTISNQIGMLCDKSYLSWSCSRNGSKDLLSRDKHRLRSHPREQLVFKEEQLLDGKHITSEHLINKPKTQLDLPDRERDKQTQSRILIYDRNQDKDCIINLEQRQGIRSPKGKQNAASQRGEYEIRDPHHNISKSNNFDKAGWKSSGNNSSLQNHGKFRWNLNTDGVQNFRNNTRQSDENQSKDGSPYKQEPHQSSYSNNQQIAVRHSAHPQQPDIPGMSEQQFVNSQQDQYMYTNTNQPTAAMSSNLFSNDSSQSLVKKLAFSTDPHYLQTTQPSIEKGNVGKISAETLPTFSQSIKKQQPGFPCAIWSFKDYSAHEAKTSGRNDNSNVEVKAPTVPRHKDNESLIQKKVHIGRMENGGGEPVSEVNAGFTADCGSNENDAFLKKVVEEVKQALRPFYVSKQINKLEYKEILKKCVPKVCSSGEIISRKIVQLVVAYVKKYKTKRQK